MENPSELLLAENHEGLSGCAIGCAIEGVRPFLVETQALVSSAAYGTPQRSATGFEQRRLNMLLAVLEKGRLQVDAERCVPQHRRRTAHQRLGDGLERNSGNPLQQRRYSN